MLLFCEKHILKTKSSRFVIWASGRFWTTFECSDRFPMQQRRFVSVKRDATVTSETVRWSESGPRWCSIPHCWESFSLKLSWKSSTFPLYDMHFVSFWDSFWGTLLSGVTPISQLTKKRWTPRVPSEIWALEGVPKMLLRITTRFSSWHFCDIVGGRSSVFCSK